MGNVLRSSNIISYEEAVERLGSIDCEIHEDGFRRISDEKGFIDSTTFYTHFLRSLIPSISTQLADAIFRGFDTRRRNEDKAYADSSQIWTIVAGDLA